MESDDHFQIEVAYATPEIQVLLPLEVLPGTTIEMAIHESSILESFPEIDLETCKVGIFGRLGKLNYELRPGDRVEIYRPLIADAKEIRRKRAAQGKKMNKGGTARSEGS